MPPKLFIVNEKFKREWTSCVLVAKFSNLVPESSLGLTPWADAEMFSNKSLGVIHRG